MNILKTVLTTFFLLFSHPISSMDDKLYTALSSGNYQQAQFALSHGANPDIYKNGLTPVHIAVQKNRADLINLLADHGAHVDYKNVNTFVEETSLIHAVRIHNMLATQTLLERGADVKLKDSIGQTAIHHAAGSGNLSIVKRLVWAGADTTEKTLYKLDPALMASAGFHKETETYLNNHALPTQQLLRIFASEDITAIAQTLKDGADANAQTLQGNPLLYLSIGEYNLTRPTNKDIIAQYLLKHGADPNTQNRNGDTPLHAAVVFNNIRMALLLVHHGADAGIYNNQEENSMTMNVDFWLNLWHPLSNHGLFKWLPFLQTIKGFL